MVDMGTRSRCRAEAVQVLIQRDIASGYFSAGQRLGEVELAQRYAVSRTPVREALTALAALGIVQRTGHKGCRVAQPEPAESCPACGSQSVRKLSDIEGTVNLCRECRTAWEMLSSLSDPPSVIGHNASF